ncbi:MAG: leucine-rich repeat domain-containing protein [Thermoguttaceae bacterium]|nr:leucine-rich repeat domain-containing protein [Thermoguttaceae bacterium]
MAKRAANLRNMGDFAMLMKNKRFYCFLASALLGVAATLFSSDSSVFAQSGDAQVPEYQLSDDGHIFLKYHGNGEKLVVPDSVTGINSGAFDRSEPGEIDLSFLAFGEPRKTFADRARERGFSLKTIVIPASVVGARFVDFWHCPSLETIEVAEDNPSLRSIDGVLYSKDGTVLKCVPSGIKKDEFIVPESVRIIERSAFAGASNLKSIILPKSLEVLDSVVFAGCSSLSSIVVPDGVSEIGMSAFEDCSSLTSIVVPDGVKKIGGNAFTGCSSLKSIDVPKSVEEIGSFMFCPSLTAINVAEENPVYRSIDGVLYSKDGKKLVRFPEGSGKESFTVPDGVEVVVPFAFTGCSSLKSIVFPKSLTEIGSLAFAGCSSLSSIALPDGVKKFGNNAFESCSSLTSFDVPESVEDIGFFTFSNCPSLKSINAAENNPYYSSSDGVLFSKDGKTLVMAPMGKVEDSFAVPEGVEEIGICAFGHCSSLERIELPESVRKIGGAAFHGCSALKTFVVPDGVKEIAGATFFYCPALSEIVIPASVEKIEYYAFYPTENLTISAPKGSYAEEFAKKKKINFKPLD